MRLWGRREESLHDELADYLDRETRDNIARGMSPADACAAARRKLGNATRVLEETRAVWGLLWIERLWQDAGHALRLFAKHPGFTFIAVLSIALGTGANTAMFSVADAAITRPLPVPDPGGVYTAGTETTVNEFSELNASYPDYNDLRARATSFEGLAAYGYLSVGLATEPDVTPVLQMGCAVSGNFFRVLGIEPTLGRGFRDEEDRVEGRDAVVVLSHATWEQVFASDPGIVGRRVLLNGIPFTVIGITPVRFTGLHPVFRPQFYVPMKTWSRLADMDYQDRAVRNLTVKGRLRPGVTLAEARAEVAAIGAALEQEYPVTNRNRKFEVRTELESRVRMSPRNVNFIEMLAVMSVAVLLVACSNVAGLLTSRAPVRAREIALKLAVGAGRARLVQQLITESLLIALAGGVFGLAAGYGGIQLARQIPMPRDYPVVYSFQLDMRVMIGSLVVALLSVLLFGLAPAIQTTRVNLTDAFKASGASTSDRRRLLGRHALVMAQVAVALMLLTVASIVYRGFQDQIARGPGFRTERVAMMSFDPRTRGYTEAETNAFYDRLIDGARALPGVRHAALASSMPSMRQDAFPVQPEGYQFPREETGAVVLYSAVHEGYFDTLGIPIVEGRAFTRRDTAEAPRVAVVNDVMAAHYWPGGSPVGKRIRAGAIDGWIEIVGVARASMYVDISEAPMEYVYLAARQGHGSHMTLVAEGAGTAEQLLEQMRELVRRIDPAMAIYEEWTMVDFLEESNTRIAEIAVEMIWLMGATGLVLALVGLYGLMTYSVNRRTREIGIRMAVGASPAGVLAMVLGQGLKLVVVGLTAGVVLSRAASDLLFSLFPVIGRGSASTYVLVTFALLGVAMAATFFPARRAARVDPTVALRYE